MNRRLKKPSAGTEELLDTSGYYADGGKEMYIQSEHTVPYIENHPFVSGQVLDSGIPNYWSSKPTTTGFSVPFAQPPAPTSLPQQYFSPERPAHTPQFYPSPHQSLRQYEMTRELQQNFYHESPYSTPVEDTKPKASKITVVDKVLHKMNVTTDAMAEQIKVENKTKMLSVLGDAEMTQTQLNSILANKNREREQYMAQIKQLKNSKNKNTSTTQKKIVALAKKVAELDIVIPRYEARLKMVTDRLDGVKEQEIDSQIKKTLSAMNQIRDEMSRTSEKDPDDLATVIADSIAAGDDDIANDDLYKEVLEGGSSKDSALKDGTAAGIGDPRIAAILDEADNSDDGVEENDDDTFTEPPRITTPVYSQSPHLRQNQNYRPVSPIYTQRSAATGGYSQQGLPPLSSSSSIPKRPVLQPLNS
jgi:hypothetical protein